jgi:nitroimidazol reductase NimA-like FMN-containing flavoprotein (pyridoxamine 5'-phosphate oxidase superfamily)
VNSTRISPYSCKYSKKIYTQHQLLVLILFKDYRNQHYRDFIEDIGDMETIQQELDLSAVPHFTTLQKFFCRIKTLYLRYAFGKTLNLFYSNNDPIPVTAIDSSGFTSGYSSHYYSIRTGKIRKHFLKTSISVDTDQQVITGFIASKSRVHDTRHAGRLLRQCHKIRKSDCYVMDKGYDSEAIHRLIREDLHADSIIPIRSWNNDVVGGTYRREMALQFDDVRYRKRQLVENKFSVLKRKFSGDLKARIFAIQKKEIAGKMIVCNIHRFLQFLVIEVFYRAKKLIKFIRLRWEFQWCKCMDILKIPRMEKQEYDRLIEKGYVCRIAFQGEKYPYIAPFLYVFDGSFLYFLSTKYGKKIEHFRKSPYVSVEIEKYTKDLSSYMFVTLQGYLEEVHDSIEKKIIREKFVDLIVERNLSCNILAALGHSPLDPPAAIAEEERSLVWKLVGVKDLIALKNL